MPTGLDMQAKVSLDALKSLLLVHGEGDQWDFKLTLDLKGNLARANLARDILAFANTEGGGYLVIGVADKTYELVGLQDDYHIDTTIIYNAIGKYINADIKLVAAEYPIKDHGWEIARRFAIIYIAHYDGLAVPSADASFQSGKKTEVILQVNQPYIRRGAQSTLFDQAAYDRLLRRDSWSDDQIEHVLRPPLSDNLPSRDEVTVDFVGRKQELLSLLTWFKDSSRRRWLLAGDGGKGKTAIAYEFASLVKSEAPAGYDCVIWLSAKRRRFIEGQIRAINSPDFWDYPSLLDAILAGYGFQEYQELPLTQKRQRVLDLFRMLPALLVVDDIDSLDEIGQTAEFLTFDVAGTASKVLLTSRRIPYGLETFTTQVAGLNEKDGVAFIESRINLLRLDKNIFTVGRMREILSATDCSPLYIEDLMRLCAVLPAAQAIAAWKENKGDPAREYAIKREFDSLAEDARKIVLACSINPGPISFTEIQAITGLYEEQIASELKTIQNLFLVSRPRLVEDVERFDINANIRALVNHVFQGTELLRRLTDNYKAISGQSPRGSRDRSFIATHIRQAVSLDRFGRSQEAEDTIKEALKRYPEHPDLMAQLGIIYSHWYPVHLTDARFSFDRAAQLKCDRESIYAAWADMEIKQQEWTAAVTAARTGMQCVGKTMRLLFQAGLAHSRLGQELKRSMHIDRAREELEEAEKVLFEALKQPHQLIDYAERDLNRRIFRAIVINYEALGRLVEVKRYLTRWHREHPDDPNMVSEAERLGIWHALSDDATD